MSDEETKSLTLTEKKQSHVYQARMLMREQHTGVLATHSLSVKGFPFGSIIPFMMTHDGNIVIYASDIAQHSRNIKTDNKVSLCVYNPTQHDSQASARVTILAQASWDAVSDVDKARYFSLFPQAIKYQNTHDFRFYLLDTTRVRYIGGFGEIYWFSKDEWVGNYANIASMEKGIIDHMHEDHLDALAQIVAQFEITKVDESHVSMLTVFPEGFHYLNTRVASKTPQFIPFIGPITEHYSARNAMVDLTHRAREASSFVAEEA